MEITPHQSECARILWHYNQLGHALIKSDVILALGCSDTRVAERTADLWYQGWAPVVVCSGRGNHAPRPEADIFAEILEARAIPRAAIIREYQANNTGENIRFSLTLLEQAGVTSQRMILVSLPFIERRAYATFLKQAPGRSAICASPLLTYESQLSRGLTEHELIDRIVGATQRVLLYPQQGHQVYQAMPVAAYDAYQMLVAAGFTSKLMGQDLDPSR
jgi:uncharacterized SAM-binding protein YcdF (DUF218 family)